MVRRYWAKPNACFGSSECIFARPLGPSDFTIIPTGRTLRCVLLTRRFRQRNCRLRQSGRLANLALAAHTTPSRRFRDEPRRWAFPAVAVSTVSIFIIVAEPRSSSHVLIRSSMTSVFVSIKILTFIGFGILLTRLILQAFAKGCD